MCIPLYSSIDQVTPNSSNNHKQGLGLEIAVASTIYMHVFCEQRNDVNANAQDYNTETKNVTDRRTTMKQAIPVRFLHCIICICKFIQHHPQQLTTKTRGAPRARDPEKIRLSLGSAQEAGSNGKKLVRQKEANRSKKHVICHGSPRPQNMSSTSLHVYNGFVRVFLLSYLLYTKYCIARRTRRTFADYAKPFLNSSKEILPSPLVSTAAMTLCEKTTGKI